MGAVGCGKNQGVICSIEIYSYRLLGEMYDPNLGGLAAFRRDLKT